MTPLLAHAAGTDETLCLILLFAGIWVAWIGWSRLRGTGFERMPRWGGWVRSGSPSHSPSRRRRFHARSIGPTPTSATVGPRPASTVSLRFLAPQDGSVASGDELTVRLDLTGGTITSVTSTTVTPDTGHVHLSLDGTLVSMVGGVLQVVNLRGVPPGTHTLTATFVAADHLPFDPQVTAEVTFERAPA